MPFKQGDKKPESSGRKKGSKNKIPNSFKQLVQETFIKLEDSGDGMDKWAKKNKTEFYKIASKLIPSDISVSVKKLGKDLEDEQYKD